MSNYGNDEQKASYLAALEQEKAGYEQRIAAAKAAGDSAAAERYAGRIKQVDAEIAAVNADNGESAVDEVDTSVDAIEEATGKQLDAIAEKLGFEFVDGVSRVADKRAALLEHVQA